MKSRDFKGAAIRRIESAWHFLRAISGDDAYERYRAHHAAAHGGEPALTPRAFFADREQRKWGGVTRCC